MPGPIIVAIDGTAASGKSTNARIVAKALGFLHVDTGAMYRTLAWYCLLKKVDVTNAKSIALVCSRWKPKLEVIGNQVRLAIKGQSLDQELRTAEVSAAASEVSSVPGVRTWMKKTQRGCARFGNLVMEGRDIGSNVFPETEFKYYLDASLEERSKRRGSDGVQENLAVRDRQDSQRAAAPLMLGLGARYINTSGLSVEQTSQIILGDVRSKLASTANNAEQ
jgi:cytidylate kinase